MHQKSPPNRGLGPFGKIINMFSEVCGWIAFAAVLGAMLVISYEVMARYLFHWATYWEIEAAIFLLILTTFVGSAYTMKYGRHISLDIMTQRMSARNQAKLDILTCLASLSFCVLVSWRCWEMWWEAYGLGWTTDSLWAPPLWIPYLFPALGFTAMSLQLIAEITHWVVILVKKEA